MRRLARLDLWAGLAYLCGALFRVWYGVVFRPPSTNVYSDMEFYLQIARMLRRTPIASLQPWDITHPLGFPAMVAVAMGPRLSLDWPARIQLLVSLLVPLAVALFGLAAFGRRTAMVLLIAASWYFPFIEYGSLFLSEIHSIFWTSLAFAAFFFALRATTRNRAIGLGVAGGLALSIAIAMKAVALPAAVMFFVVYGLILLVERRSPRAAVSLGLAALLGVLPLLVPLARVCTHANRGHFCITGNKAPSDFLLGHYGQIAGIQWGTEQGRNFFFGSPGSFLRHYDYRASVPFTMYDGPANTAEAWRWIRAHPADALVLSLDHLWDTFFGTGMWPSFANGNWQWAHLSQMIFIALLLFPTLWVVVSGRARKQVLLVLAPVVGLCVVVLIATGEVRYRVPFDIFFMAVTGALFSREL
jgi:hypothetical protein